MSITANQVHLDLRMRATGVYDAGTDTTTWTTPVPCFATHAVVLATGVQVAITPTNTSTRTAFTATGDYAGDAVLGVPFASTAELARPVPAGPQGQPDLLSGFIVKSCTVVQNEPSAYTVTVDLPSPWQDRVSSHAANFSGGGLSRYTFMVGAKAESSRIIFSNSDWRPMRIHGYEIQGEAVRGIR